MKKKDHRINLLLVIIILSFICTILLLKKLNKNIMPLLLSYSAEESKKIITYIVSDTIKKEIVNNKNIEDLCNIEKDTGDEIRMVTYNTSKVNEILTNVNDSMQNKIKNIENGNVDKKGLLNTQFSGYEIDKLNKGIIYEVPVFLLSNNVFLTNLGPKIPIKISFLGDVYSRIETKITEYGLNNALIQLGIYIEITVKINLPFVSKTIKVNNVIPLFINVMEGKIPQSYLQGITYPSDNLITKIG